MRKWLAIGLLVILVGGAWAAYVAKGSQAREIRQRIEAIEYDGLDEEDELEELKSRLGTLEGERTFNGILLAFLSAGLIGVAFVVYALPAIAHRFTHTIYDSGELVEPDPLRVAHALLAQGDYEGAIAAFRETAATDPLNRLPWVEISKVQRTHLEDPQAALTTLRNALESQEWGPNDAAFLMFRIAELYDEDLHQRDLAAMTMQQVIDELPETRHAANARHRLREWGIS